MKTTKRHYSKDFKEKVVSLSHQRENISLLAEELGISVSRIYKWRAQQRNSHSALTVPKDQQSRDTDEVRQIKKELKNALQELEILKKAIHIFSKRDGSITNL